MEDILAVTTYEFVSELKNFAILSILSRCFNSVNSESQEDSPLVQCVRAHPLFNCIALDNLINSRKLDHIFVGSDYLREFGFRSFPFRWPMLVWVYVRFHRALILAPNDSRVSSKSLIMGVC